MNPPIPIASGQPASGWSTRDTDDFTTLDVPLTPTQQWFFEVQPTTPHQWNESLLLADGPTLPPAGWEAVVAALVAHHDALRLRFAPEEGTWRQSYGARESQRIFIEVDLSAAGCRWPSALERATARLQRSLNLVDGPLIRLALFHGPTPAEDRIFIVVHRAVADSVSWSILLDDLHRASVQWKAGLPIDFPGKTSSFRGWVDRLHTLTPTLDPATSAYWEAFDARQKTARVPRDTSGVNSVGSQRHVRFALTDQETEAFLELPRRAYGIDPQDVLVAAVAATVADWTGRSEAVLAVEGHGRESHSDGLNLTRTVGCFTTLVPVCVTVPRAGGPGAILRAVTDQLRAVPRCALHALCRSVAPDRAAAPPDVKVSYRGRFDRLLGETGVLATELTGRGRHPAAPRAFVLDVDAGVTENRLRVTIAYSANLHWSETIDTFGYALATRLRAFIRHDRALSSTQDEPGRAQAMRALMFGSSHAHVG